MTQLEKELIKSLAYGETAEVAADNNVVTVDEVNKLIVSNLKDIEVKKDELRKCGYID
ncbi:MAG: hypothetical protein PUD99_01525 [Turicibacter sp.]|nr:hypothetical protein [Turicibacter sp.]